MSNSNIQYVKQVLDRFNNTYSSKDYEKTLFEFEHLQETINEQIAIGKYSSVIVQEDSALTCSIFINKYEMTSTPLIIRNSISTWKAIDNWEFDTLFINYSECKFMCGEDDANCEPLMISMGEFLEYMYEQEDQYPLYMFDPSFYFDEIAKQILFDYHVPRFFPTNPDQATQELGVKEEVNDCDVGNKMYDLLSYLGEARRPPYRWFLIGPKRSGSKIHKDPYGTSAWNTLVKGRKLWIMFPPNTSEDIVEGISTSNGSEENSKSENCASSINESCEQVEALDYFVDILPRIQQIMEDDSKIYVGFQQEGDTVFIPSGWWHAVLNLTDTVAITQNYCSFSNFENVFNEINFSDEASEYDQERGSIWSKKLKECVPQLSSEIDRLVAKR